jgi:hypothetical protein
LVGENEGKKPLGRPKRRLEGNIRLGLEEIGWEDVNWMLLSDGMDKWQTCEHGNDTSGSIKGRGFLD